ncbi:hypothetical protein [Paenibacillus physcomitrellae]|uniref:Tail specific protease domain-containing protein n=1 Tax=Paenibacillus physcomitrellae TaxID=1619311 RepID=A0ABQ1GBM2_9BACL|nr:hypothetical protein [Paenibacillus physcomitrellae]GGA40508.1 hypothetical protein GCM10010917_27170 [Paenibacillus physcomitrellae]
MENEEIYYINAGLLAEGEIDRIMEESRNTKGLIIDLRNYPSTELTYKFAEYLIPSEKEFAIPGLSTVNQTTFLRAVVLY